MTRDRIRRALLPGTLFLAGGLFFWFLFSPSEDRGGTDARVREIRAGIERLSERGTGIVAEAEQRAVRIRERTRRTVHELSGDSVVALLNSELVQWRMENRPQGMDGP